MEKISKIFSMFLMGTVAMGLASCSSSDDEDSSEVVDPVTYPTEAPASLEQVSKDYVDNVVFVTYKNLANEAAKLSAATKTLYEAAAAGTMTQANIDAACDAFKSARMYWEQSEAFLYGAAEDKNIDPHIDSWPLDQNQIKDVLTNASMVAKLKEQGAKYVRGENKGDDGDFDTALGFHGLEFVLFREGKNRTVAALNANETAEGMTSVKGIDELVFATAVADDLRDKAYQLEYCWLGSQATADHIAWLNSDNCSDILTADKVSTKGNSYGENYKATGTSNGDYDSWEAFVSNVFVGGCSNISQEVYSQKLGQAYRVATGDSEEGDAGDYIESPYSKRSFKDYQDNIYSIKNSLYGTTDITATAPLKSSILNYVQKKGYERTANLSYALNNAINTLEKAKNSGKAFVDAPGDPQVQECINAVKALDDELQKAGSWIGKN